MRSTLDRLLGGISALLVIRGVIRANIEFEQGLIGVGKTTDLAGAQLESLGDEIIALSTRIPVGTRELLTIGQAAGQLGVKGADNILKFTETVARLGTASDLSGDVAATALARILNVTREQTGTVDVLASVIVRLGNNVAATEAEIADHATNVAQATAVYEIGSARAAGFAATLAELGVESQLAGTTIGQTFRALDKAIREGGESLELLQRLTGLSREELAAGFREDPTGVVQAYLRGLGQVVEQGGSAASVLEKFQLANERSLKVLPVLAQNHERLARNIGLAADEAANVTALTIESERAFDSLGSRLGVLRNRIHAVYLLMRDSNGEASDFVQTVSDAIAVLFGLQTGQDAASGSAVALANAVRLVAIALGLVVAVKVPLYFYSVVLSWYTAIATATGLTTSIQLLTASLVGLAAFDFGSYLFNEFRVVHDAALDFIMGIELAWATLVHGFQVGVQVVRALILDAILAVVREVNEHQGMFRALGAVLGVNIPIVNTIAAAATELEKRVEKEQLLADLAVLGSMAELGAEYERITSVYEEIDRQANEQFDAAGRATGRSYYEAFGEGVSEAVDDVLRVIDDSGKRIVEEMNQVTDLDLPGAPVPAELTEGMEELAGAVASVGEEADRSLNSVLQFISSLELERSLIGRINEERDRAIQIAEVENHLRALSVDQLNEVNRALREGLALPELSAEKAELIVQAVDLIRGKLKQLNEAQELDQFFQSAGDSVGQFVGDVIFEFDRLEDVVESFIRSLSRQFFDFFVARQLSQAVAGGLSSLFTRSALGNAFDRGNVVRFAQGGILPGPALFGLRDGLGIAGEAGPEAVVPLVRTRTGRLGVDTTGTGGPRVTVQGPLIAVYANNPDEFGASRRQIMEQGRAMLTRLGS